MISFEPVQTVYHIKLTVPEFQKIMDYDNVALPPLFELLAEIDGVNDVEYDGHFGASIWLTLDKEHDTGKTWNQISDIIEIIIEKK